MRDRFAIQKMICFVLLALIYMVSVILAAKFASEDVAAAISILGMFVVGGLALGVGVIE